MLGEVAYSLEQAIRNKEPPLLIYDGERDTKLGKLARNMQQNGWFADVFYAQEYALRAKEEDCAIIVGRHSERYDDLWNIPQRAIFINNEGIARESQTKDGYFPDVVFAAPELVMPLLYVSLEERLKHKSTSVEEFMEMIAPLGGVAAQVAHGAYVLGKMATDSGCARFLTLSGAMTIAKMGLVVCDLIDSGMVQYLASTGALMAHGLVESIGLKHYKYNPAVSDKILAEQKLNRVTDTLEPEENFTHVDEVVNAVLQQFSGLENISPRIFHRAVGEYLAQNYPQERGILRSAYEKQVPVVVPAFGDSEIGNDVYVHNLQRQQESRPRVAMDLELDSEYLIELATNAKRRGIFTIGGGVPRNNTQNVAPLIEIINNRLQMNLPETMFTYGVRIAPDKRYLGHLTGCTYSEGMSWRKMDVNGLFAEIEADATIVLPFLAKYALETMKKSA